jgi:LmbE family N-acetylglucosaminyl deacetylase
VLAPHPDDEVIGCGGAIMRHVSQGDPVTVVLATDGTAAERHAELAARDAYRTARLEESRAAAGVMGYKDIRQWGAEDRRLSEWPALDEQLRGLVKELRPVTLYAPSVYEIHPDHFALGEAVCRHAVVFDPTLRLVFYEIGWLAPVNLLLDITPYIERKREALGCFRSQLAIREYVRHMEALNVYRTYTLPVEVRAAEGYLSLTAGELATTPLRCFGRSRFTDRLGLVPRL